MSDQSYEFVLLLIASSMIPTLIQEYDSCGTCQVEALSTCADGDQEDLVTGSCVNKCTKKRLQTDEVRPSSRAWEKRWPSFFFSSQTVLVKIRAWSKPKKIIIFLCFSITTC